MKKLFLAALLLTALPFALRAQILNPVKWRYSAKKIGEGQYLLHLKAAIDRGWHLYAQDAGEGPVPTSFSFEKAEGTQLVGKVREVGHPRKTFDKNFNAQLKYYQDSVDFVQFVKVKPGTAMVKGSLEYMVCDDRQCLPPKTLPFVIRL